MNHHYVTTSSTSSALAPAGRALVLAVTELTVSFAKLKELNERKMTRG